MERNKGIQKPHEQWTDEEFSAWKRDQYEQVIDLVDKDLGRDWINMLTVSFVETYRNHHLSEKAQRFLRDELQGRNLLDLGCGSGAYRTARTFIQKYGIAEYVGIDLGSLSEETEILGRPARVVADESLRFLRQVSDDSAQIMSNGLLCSEWMGRSDPLSREYLRRLFGQIYRVLPSGGIFFATHFDLDEFTGEAGLKKEKEFGKEWHLVVYRKR